MRLFRIACLTCKRRRRNLTDVGVLLFLTKQVNDSTILQTSTTSTRGAYVFLPERKGGRITSKISKYAKEISYIKSKCNEL